MSVENAAKSILDEVNKGLTTMIKDMKQDLLNEVTDSVKRKFVEEASEKAVSRMKLNATPEFQRKGNKQQFEFNQNVQTEIVKALESIEANQLDKAKEALTAGKSIIDKRQKLIRIADREADGWEVVNCYLSDDLAANTDDEKSISRARREASARKKQLEKEKEKRNKTKKRYNNYNKPYSIHREHPSDEVYRGERKSTPTGRFCYICGREGHIQYYCPQRTAKSDI